MPVDLNDNALITQEELETFLQETISDSDYKNTLINFASDLIEKYTGRHLKLKTYTDEEYDGNGSLELYLNQFPIVSVTDVKYWNSINNVEIYAYTERVEFLVYGVEGYIFMRSGWVKGNKNYRVTYTAGYENIPYDIKKACADLCSLMHYHKDKTGIKSEKIGAYSITLDKDGKANVMGVAVPAEILGVLNMYRKINM
nr:hypothetical protein 17 [Elusimicrobiota bacterium]